MVTLHEVLSRLQRVEKHGDQYLACCPCHNDKKQSLSVAQGEKGIVFKCYAGCESGDIVRALGFEWRDLFGDTSAVYRAKPVKNARNAPKTEEKAGMTEQKPKQKTPVDASTLGIGGIYKGETITRVYEYTDADSKPIMRVCRTDKKSFPTIHYDGGAWYWGDGGHTDALYHLPELLRAVKIGEPVYIVEGEKDVETLRHLGLTATTNKGGAGKWNPVQSQHFRGAVVYIVPDNDGPGKKHAQVLLHALRPVAKEVRILTLTRQNEAQIPEKGDVSDLAEALGDARALDVLHSLADSSPVLARNVTDADYVDYFLAADGCAVENACIYGFTSDKSRRLLSNFVALPVEQLLIDDGSEGETPRYEWAIDGWSATGRKLRRIRIGAEEFEAMKWPMRHWGIDAIVTDGNGVAAKLRRFIQAAGSAAAVRRTVYTHTGWREIDGKLVYLHGTGAIGADDVDIRLDFGLERYSLDGLRSGPWADMDRDEALPLCQSATLRAMTVAGLRVGVPIIGYLFLSPLLHFLRKSGRRPSVIPFVRGKTGAGKTTLVTLLMNHYGYNFHFESEQPASFADSTPSVEKKLYMMKDMPLLVDDYKNVADAKQMSARRGLVEMIIRMVCDGLKRSRMTAEMTARKDYPARSLCIMTGEELPSETGDSNVARLFIINMEPGDAPLPDSKATEARKQEMNDLWKLARQGAFNESMRGYITYLASIAEELPARLEDLYDELYQEAQKRLGTNVGHARLPGAAAYLMLGVRMMLEYMRQPGGMFTGMTDEELAGMMSGYWAALAENSQAQADLMRTQTPTQIFVTTLRETIQSGRAVLLPMGGAPKILPPGVVGYKDERLVYLIPGEALGAVSRSLDAQKMALPVGKTTLLRQLKEEGISIVMGEGTTQQVKRGTVHGRFLVLPRDLVLEETPDEKQMTMVDAEENPF